MNTAAEEMIIRRAVPEDGAAISSLFAEDEINRYQWSAEKWRHYYTAYPDGQPVALVAQIGRHIVGHYGMLPVKVGDCQAMLGLHAYVTTAMRGLTVISSLMAEVDRVCQEQGAAFICGFANPNFALIKKTFFKWQIAFWLGFKKNVTPSDIDRGNAPFYFRYSDDWFPWRFGTERSCYLSRFDDPVAGPRKQLLKIRTTACNHDLLSGSECWSRALMYDRAREGEFSQPFSLKVYDHTLLDQGILRHENWHIEMGDSDTFSYNPWSEP